MAKVNLHQEISKSLSPRSLGQRLDWMQYYSVRISGGGWKIPQDESRERFD